MVNKLYFYCLALFVAPTFSAFGQTQPSQDENGYYLTSNPQLSSSASFLRLNVLSSLN